MRVQILRNRDFFCLFICGAEVVDWADRRFPRISGAQMTKIIGKLDVRFPGSEATGGGFRLGFVVPRSPASGFGLPAAARHLRFPEFLWARANDQKHTAQN